MSIFRTLSALATFALSHRNVTVLATLLALGVGVFVVDYLVVVVYFAGALFVAYVASYWQTAAKVVAILTGVWLVYVLVRFVVRAVRGRRSYQRVHHARFVCGDQGVSDVEAAREARRVRANARKWAR